MKTGFLKKTADVRTVLSLDIRSLALFRVLLGMCVIFDTITRLSFVPAFYSDEGILPRELVSLSQYEHAWHFQLMFLSGSEWFSYLFLGILLVCGIQLLAGYKTRLAVFLCWLLLCSAIIRDPLTAHAGDTLLIVLLFWAMFLPLGRAFSADSFMNRSTEPKESLVFSAATVALYLQIALVYIMTGIFKAANASWTSGTFLYLTLSRFDYVKPLAFLIYPHYELLSFLTHFTLYLELFGPLLFFLPFFFLFFRLAAIILFLGLQLSIGLTVDVGLFPLISITGILVFLPSEFWAAAGSKFSGLTSRFPEFYNAFSQRMNSVLNRLPGNRKREGTFSSPGIAENIVVSLLITYVVIWNLSQVTYLFVALNPPKQPGYLLKLDQRWNMFASPDNASEHLSLEVTFKDGTVKDLMQSLKVEHHSSPDFDHVGYASYRWRIFFSNNLRTLQYSKYQPSYMKYMMKKKIPNKKMLREIKKVELVGYYQETGEFYNHSSIERRVINYLNIELDEDGNIVGINIDNASKKLDLQEFTFSGIPALVD